MNLQHPDVTSLFKYYPIEKNQVSALAQQKLWYSKPAGFNDPFDTRFYVDGKLRKYVSVASSQRTNSIFNDDMSHASLFKKYLWKTN